MIIGLIGFGKVCQNLFKLIRSEDIQFVTSTEKRSRYTIDAIEKSGIDIFPTFKDVAIRADILVSATSPSKSVEVAKQYGKYSNGIYLDLNNISPQTTFEIDNHVSNLIDGSIIGKIDSKNPTIYISGKSADELLFLNEFINVKVLSDRIGDASILKLLRSSYTKTLTALLIESYQIAQNYELEKEFFEVISLTEGDDFKERSISRIENTLKSSKRKSEELNEIIDCFDKNDLIMVRAALEKFSQL